MRGEEGEDIISVPRSSDTELLLIASPFRVAAVHTTVRNAKSFSGGNVLTEE